MSFHTGSKEKSFLPGPWPEHPSLPWGTGLPQSGTWCSSRAGSPGAGCSGPCLTGVRASPRTETPQLLWAMWSRLWPPFEWKKKWFSYAYTISCKCLLPLVLWLGTSEKRPSPQLPPSGEMYPLTHMSKTPLSLLFSRLCSPTSLSFSSFHHISPYRVELPQMAHKHHISFTPIGILAGSLTKGNISPVISAVPYGTVVPPQACCSCI